MCSMSNWGLLENGNGSTKEPSEVCERLLLENLFENLTQERTNNL